jgi:hypothetical protein
MRNFFIGLTLCLNKSKYIEVEKFIKSRYYDEEIRHLFNNSNYNLSTNNNSKQVSKLSSETSIPSKNLNI